MSDARPIVAISMGDPAGIGPEICVRAARRAEVLAICRPVVVGDAGVMRRAAEVVGAQGSVAPVARVAEAEAEFAAGRVNVLDLKNVDAGQFRWGEVSAMAGNAAFEAVRKVIELATAGEVAATVTAPIHKEALFRAGHKFPGHTEIFAHFTGTSDFTMMLAAGTLRVVHVSTHVSLRQACDAVTRQRVGKVIRLGYDACRQLGIEKPRIGVAGLNPHAGDGGLFGTEEREHIIPACEDARGDGIDVEGPVPADTFFAKAAGGAYDLCVAMYHDQGHIPVKMRGFKYDGAKRAWTDVRGINVSLGMPIVRVSVDHGTAFDQAGKGTASDASLVEAIEYAARMAGGRAARAGGV